ncbi:unnamed protein product [Adineta ricciae]|uniref:cyclin-dependent kinase n=1 Tax=Adineta ricciae TaxID=249248 RepID=A0A813T424_ADIRI|nr:unnamed protein product [Adineta ricciae]CAF0838703.1 unnamed protein product [Adineta ricciae]
MMRHIPRKVKDKFEVLGVIGEGAYGLVLKARKKESEQVVAIKYFKQMPGYNSDIDIVERELRILQSLRFENIVELIEWFRDKKRYFLIFEYVDSNMLEVLQEHPTGLPLEQVRQLSHQLFSGVHWCHTHEIIHRDIKPENLLISKSFVLKLCDFGFARFCNGQASADYYTNYVATRWYRSPELLVGSAYGKSVDIWACGCIMAELATGQALFAGESDIDQLYRIQKSLGQLPMKYLEDMIRNPKFEGFKFPTVKHVEPLESQFNQIFPADFLHLFKNCLQLRSADRLTSEQCIQHDAFYYLNHKRSQSLHQRETPSQAESRLSRSYEDSNLIPTRHRSSSTNHNVSVDEHTDLSFASASFTCEKSKHHTSNALPDRSVSFNQHRPKIIRARTRTYSSSSDEEGQSSTFKSRSVNENIDTNTSLLRKTYLPSQQSTPSIREQSSSTLRHDANEVLLRPKPQPPVDLIQTSLQNINKRFSLDQYRLVTNNQQQIPESYVYRSSMIIVPEPTREGPVNDTHLLRSKTRESKRDLFRSQSVHCHPTSDTATNAQRIPSKQTVSDVIGNNDADSTVSSSVRGNRSFEQQVSNVFPRTLEQRRNISGSDSHLSNLSINRSSFGLTKGDHTYMNKNALIPQQDLTSITKLSTHSKTSSDLTRRQPSNSSLFSVYPPARIAMKHMASALTSSSQPRSTPFRNSALKSPQDEN